MWTQLEAGQWYTRAEIAALYGSTVGTVSRWFRLHGGLERRLEYRTRHYTRRDGSERSTWCRVAMWRLRQ